MVLKPRSSVETEADGGVRITGRPRYARDPQELLARSEDLIQICSQMLAQEFVDGEGVGYFALMCHGELRAEFAHRRIRDVSAPMSHQARDLAATRAHAPHTSMFLRMLVRAAVLRRGRAGR